MSSAATDTISPPVPAGRQPLLFVRSSLVPLILIVVLTFAFGLLAWRVSADETVPIGTEADRIYITDGFYEPQQSPDQGIYRWSQPLAQLTLPGWGAGRIHIAISGVGASSSEALLTIAGEPVARTAIQPGQPWEIEAWGVSSSLNPTVTLESPPFTAPGDSRTLGLLVKSLEIYAPEARLRVFLHIALLGISGLLLFAFLYRRTTNLTISTIAGVSLLALLATFAVYRDPWTGVVAWVASLALLAMCLLDWQTTRRAGQETSSRPRIISHSLLIFLSLTFALLLLYMGYMNAFDADRMFQVAAGIAEYGRPTRYPGFDTWTKYGFGQPLIAVPFYFLGKLGVLLGGALDPVTRLTVSFTNLAVTSLTCWLLYRASRRFSSTTVAIVVAATYLVATLALNYARTFFSEPAGALLLLAALLLIIPRNPDEPVQPRRLLYAGACLGAMILFKPAFAVYLVAPGLAVLWLVFRRQPFAAPALADRRSALAARFVPLVMFGIGPAVALIVQAVYNYVRYEPLPDAIFRTGYEKEAGFSTPLLEGLGGLLFSPGKSIFLYAPVLLLVPFGIWLMYRSRGGSGKLTVVLILAETVAGFLFNALWWAWTGNFAWGPRLIMPILPLLVWPLASLGAFATHAASTTVRRLISGSWIALAALGALVSIPGALVDFQVYYRSYGLYLAGDPGEPITIYDPANSPLLVEPGYLLNGLTAAIQRPTLASTGMPPIWDIIVPSALVLLSLLCLWYGTRNLKRVG
ncbi:MAG: glycosyltransferase family 39 protein [Chloroflexota bacterium]